MKKTRSLRRTGSAGFAAIVATALACALPTVAMGSQGPGEQGPLGSLLDDAIPIGSGSGDPAAANSLRTPSYASCPGELSQPFLPWNDEDSYSLAPGGSFETDSDPWYLTGDAGVTDGNEPFYIGSPDDSHMVVLPGYSTATSVPICITKDHPNFRFFAYSEGAAGTRLRVQVLFLDRKGKLHKERVATAFDTGPGVIFDSGELEFDSDWQVSPEFPVVANDYLKEGQTGQIELLFTPIGGRSSWSIDDVYVDPRHRN